MNALSVHILRIGLGVTFVWIGVLIFNAPETFAGYIRPWAMDILPVSIRQTMRATGVLDVVIGVAFLIGIRMRLTAFVASIHLLVILIVSGITDITVRDIGLLSGTVALFLNRKKNVS